MPKSSPGGAVEKGKRHTRKSRANETGLISGSVSTEIGRGGGGEVSGKSEKKKQHENGAGDGRSCTTAGVPGEACAGRTSRSSSPQRVFRTYSSSLLSRVIGRPPL